MPDALKDTLYTHESIEGFAAAFVNICTDFDVDKFLTLIFDDQWDALELKQRMRHIALALHATLPNDYHTALAIMLKATPDLMDYGWLTLSLNDYVELYGLDDWEASIPALEEFTPLCSSEFAIRPFIIRYPERTMDKMLEWAHHPSHDVRRLSSEGCRPRLPWGIALPAFKADPTPILPILEALKTDESEYVRRSVSNNLNDISKDNPQVVLDTLRRWNDEHKTPEMEWMINHALRTLIKAANPDTLSLLGFERPVVEVSELKLEPEIVPMGDKLTFSFNIKSQSDVPQSLMIDYIVHLMRKNGQQTEKVFKLARKNLLPGETLQITQKRSFASISTRKYYPGEHAIEIQINGQRYQRTMFLLAE
jgi:3-methyladenine DNA glycosylase AlkC